LKKNILKEKIKTEKNKKESIHSGGEAAEPKSNAINDSFVSWPCVYGGIFWLGHEGRIVRAPELRFVFFMICNKIKLIGEAFEKHVELSEM